MFTLKPEVPGSKSGASLRLGVGQWLGKRRNRSAWPARLFLPPPPGQVGDEHDVVGQAKKEALPAVYGRFAVETKGWPGR